MPYTESKSESEERTITISPGVTTGELMAFFLQHNICFESDVVLPTVTYGGVFTGACHVRTAVFIHKVVPQFIIKSSTNLV